MVKTNFTHSDIVLVLRSFDVFRKNSMYTTVKLDSLCLFCMCPRERFMSLINLVKRTSSFSNYWFLALRQTIYQRVASYNGLEDFKQDVRYNLLRKSFFLSVFVVTHFWVPTKIKNKKAKGG